MDDIMLKDLERVSRGSKRRFTPFHFQSLYYQKTRDIRIINAIVCTFKSASEKITALRPYTVGKGTVTAKE